MGDNEEYYIYLEYAKYLGFDFVLQIGESSFVPKLSSKKL